MSDSTSMNPTITDDDIYIIKKINSQDSLRKNEIISFRLRNGKNLIKRVVATEGDEVKYDGFNLYVNGELYFSMNEKSKVIPHPDHNIEWIVPEDCFFVLGDNYLYSSDSRYFGPVPKKAVYGKVIQKIWPLNEVCFLKGN